MYQRRKVVKNQKTWLTMRWTQCATACESLWTFDKITHPPCKRLPSQLSFSGFLKSSQEPRRLITGRQSHIGEKNSQPLIPPLSCEWSMAWGHALLRSPLRLPRQPRVKNIVNFGCILERFLAGSTGIASQGKRGSSKWIPVNDKRSEPLNSSMMI